MIAGDPDRFAMQFQVIDAWNVQGDSWRNGVLCVYAGGVRIFDAVEALELRSALSFFSGIRLPDSTADLIYEDREVFDNARAYFLGGSAICYQESQIFLLLKLKTLVSCCISKWNGMAIDWFGHGMMAIQ